MGKAMIRVSIAIILVCLFFSGSAVAQVSPTTQATISGSVSDNDGKGVSNAQVVLSGPKSESTRTDVHGLFVFVGVPYGTYEVSAVAPGLGTATQSHIVVQGDTNIAIQYEPTSVNGLKTIASVTASVNAQFNVTPASVTQVDPRAYAFSGGTSWRTILEQIPGVSVSGMEGNAVSNSLTNGPFVPVQIQINGALPYESATLLDGMPLVTGEDLGANLPGSGTDLGFYSLNSFDGADVIQGPGADAPSIIDSIGGSLVLRPAGVVGNDHYELSLSTDPYGGIVSNALAAVRWHKLSATFTYGVNDSPGPMSGGQLSAASRNPTTVNGMGFNCPAGFSGCASGQPLFSGFTLYGYNDGILACCAQVSDAWSQHQGSVSLIYALSPAISAAFFYSGQSSQMPDLGYPYLETINFKPAAGYSGNLSAGQYFLTHSIINDSAAALESSSLVEEKITAQLGEGTIRLAALQNNTFSFNSVNEPQSESAQLFGAGCLASAPGGTGGCPSGYAFTSFNGGTYNLTFPYSLSEQFYNWANNRDLLLSYSTPLGTNFHAGGSFVQSYYNMPCEEIVYLNGASYSSYPHVRPSAISQTTREMRFFFGGDIANKISFDFSEYFVNADYHVGASVGVFNADNTPYFDSTYTYSAPRLGIVWRPTGALAVRGALGGGYAQAPLFDIVGLGSTPIYSSAGNEYILSEPNFNLRPETSFAYDLGADIRLPKNTTVSLDITRADLFGQVYSSYAFTTYTGPEGTLPLLTCEYLNLAHSRYETLLLDVHHDVPRGTFWSLGGGLIRGYVVSVPAGFYNNPAVPCTNCTNLEIVPGVNFNGATGIAAVPYAQGSGKIGYRWNPRKYVDLVGTYYGNGNSYNVPAFVEFDGDVQYPVTKKFSLLLTFRNITGVYDLPYQLRTASSFIGVPTEAGGPEDLESYEFGPRTVILTANISL